MAVLVLLSVILVRNLKVENPGKKQLALESIITTFNNLFSDVLGEKGKAYIPYLITVILYIGMANIAGIFGFKPPTKDLNVTAALAIMSIVMVQVVCISNSSTYKCNGACNKTIVVMYAIVRQCFRCICCNEIN